MRTARVERLAGVDLRRCGTWRVEGTGIQLFELEDGTYRILNSDGEERRRCEEIGWCSGMSLSFGETRAIVGTALGSPARFQLAHIRYCVMDTRWTLHRHEGLDQWIVTRNGLSRPLGFGGRTRWATRRDACEAIGLHLRSRDMDDEGAR